MEGRLNGWEKIGGTWQKRFSIAGTGELTVIVGQQEGSVDGLAFKVRSPDGSAEEDQYGTRLEDWIDPLSPEAIIEIVAKRDKYLADLSESTT